ncbi:glycosyltransferase [Rheinheimera sp. UJ51]|uniref:glycosyltransferase n=1 Tax=Rheinheimera sp. UJ51 TaxID=2892446 RepID=UPI00226E54C7|nr:glycosyltransferase [Rheinheimera sp. UJ51]MCC5450275.1 glycosyltransferase [Rheinheimera sp. UJ51]
MDISVVIPSYNAMGKLERCLTSLRNQTISPERYEVIFVDDCSTDGTFAYLQRQAATAPNWQVLQLDSNSGSPSKPRNVGTAKAQGEYVFYLDCDDEILPDTLEVHFAHAKATDACIVRGYLLADDGKSQQPMNRLPQWQYDLDRKSRIEQILSYQSTIPCSLIKRSVLQQGLAWPEELRMGEDSVFLASVLTKASKIEYIEHPTYIYNQRSSFTASSTQAYGARELGNHLQVWQRVQQLMATQAIDYFALRLQKGLQAVLRSLIYKNKNDIDDALFNQFSKFITDNWALIETFSFNERFKSVLLSLVKQDFVAFQQATKPRLLVAGYDLKFIKSALPRLSQYFDVQTDEWTGHNSHNEAASKIKLQWADYIWCEWLLGNAVWYSKHKLKHQKLVIRMHRFELSREFGELLNVDNVDAISAVSVLFFERLIERFANIPREKVRLLPNFVDADGYQQVDFAASRFNLAMIGFVPAKKGFAEALQILKALRQHDSRYRLKLFGKAPADLPWLKNHPEELTYFESCEQYIQNEGLADAVEYVGFADIKLALAEHQIGFVLSVSEAVRDLPGFESFHLAVTDAYAAGAVGLIRYWTGCEYVYPQNLIHQDNNKLISQIVAINHEPIISDGFKSDLITKLERDYCLNQFIGDVFKIYREI